MTRVRMTDQDIANVKAAKTAELSKIGAATGGAKYAVKLTGQTGKSAVLSGTYSSKKSATAAVQRHNAHLEPYLKSEI